MPEHRLTELFDTLEACLGDDAPTPPDERTALFADGRAALAELRAALASVLLAALRRRGDDLDGARAWARARWPVTQPPYTAWLDPPGPVPHWLDHPQEQP